MEFKACYHDSTCKKCQHLKTINEFGYCVDCWDGSDLDLRFEPYYRSGQRIKVTYKDGVEVRCYVGKSTGWKPVFLAILRRNSVGGSDLLNSFVDKIEVVKGNRFDDLSNYPY